MKTFAFKLSDKGAKDGSKWKARDGISLAGCSFNTKGEYRYPDWCRCDSGNYC